MKETVYFQTELTLSNDIEVTDKKRENYKYIYNIYNQNFYILNI